MQRDTLLCSLPSRWASNPHAPSPPGETWPSVGSIILYHATMQLDLFCRREGKWSVVPYVQAFFALRDNPDLCQKCRFYPALLAVICCLPPLKETPSVETQSEDCPKTALPPERAPAPSSSQLSYPQWDPDTATGNWQIKPFLTCILEGLRRTRTKPINYSKLSTISQNLEENPSAL